MANQRTTSKPAGLGGGKLAADAPELLALAPGKTIIDHFTYAIRDLATAITVRRAPQ
jgi:hypothetical protein